MLLALRLLLAGVLAADITVEQVAEQVDLFLVILR
jgi:hypothetical protein